MNIATRLRKKGRVYYFPLRTPDRKTTLRSTRCTTLDDAIRAVRESGWVALDEAARHTALTHSIIGPLTTGRKMTMEKALEKFGERIKLRSSAKHSYNAVCSIRSWIKFAGVEKLPPAAIVPEFIGPFINNPESLAKAGTRRVKLAHLRTFFDFILDNGWCSMHPANLVDVNMAMLSHAQKETRVIDPYTPDEVRFIVDSLEAEVKEWSLHIARLVDRLSRAGLLKTEAIKVEHDIESLKQERLRLIFWRAAVLLASNTGLRFADIACLEWHCFDEPGVIVVHTAKTNKRVTPRLQKEMNALVSQLPVRHPRYLFPEEQAIATDPKGRAKLSVWFARLCAKLNLPYKGFHSFRHGHATQRNAAGEDLSAIAKDLGHSSTRTTKGYVH